MEGVIFVRVEKCLACRSCEIACALEHSESKELVPAIAESPRPRPRVSVEEAGEHAIPLQCRQCEEAPCLKVCPTKAIFRSGPNQPIGIDRRLCIGCKWCVLACPFGVVRMDNESRLIIKCDMCMERLSRGERPACVSACPTRALQFRTLAEIVSEKRKRTSEKFLTEIEK